MDKPIERFIAPEKNEYPWVWTQVLFSLFPDADTKSEIYTKARIEGIITKEEYDRAKKFYGSYWESLGRFI